MKKEEIREMATADLRERLAAQKLPVITKFVVRRDYDPSQNV